MLSRDLEFAKYQKSKLSQKDKKKGKQSNLDGDIVEPVRNENEVSQDENVKK
uniref:Uncharacterized protein n=1 Tax=Cruciviridae sp. TaxID=1955495 RepID=A0A1S6LVL6_9VIRU|nr:hypothetical protein [Cruciviridae sp.]AQU11803.1 hypothetical protein [Cruciviridae sp.]